MPEKTYFGSYVAAAHGTPSNFDAPYDIKNNTNPVIFNTDGSIVGYKYFNFNKMCGKSNPQLLLRLIPELGMKLAGAVCDFTEPATGQNKLFFPVE